MLQCNVADEKPISNHEASYASNSNCDPLSKTICLRNKYAESVSKYELTTLLFISLTQECPDQVLPNSSFALLHLQEHPENLASCDGSKRPSQI